MLVSRKEEGASRLFTAVTHSAVCVRHAWPQKASLPTEPSSHCLKGDLMSALAIDTPLV